jgi:hypothetical protein
MTKKWSEVRRKHAPEVEARIREEVEAAAPAKEQAPSEPLTFEQWIRNGTDHFNALARADQERET